MQNTSAKPKLNVLLAKTDHLATNWRNAIKDFIKFFKSGQAAFKGEKKTFEVYATMQDMPSERGNKLVVTTVNEKLDWLVKNQKEYIDALFAQEATNASGLAKAELMVDGQSFGKYSSLELLRLKSLLENGEFEEMYAHIPVREEDKEWKETTQEQYKSRVIFEDNLLEGERITTQKENYILPDPNIEKLGAGKNYQPMVATKDTILKVGKFTYQRFSGEWSHRQRAEVLNRRSKLLSATIEALKVANEVEAVASNFTAEKLFGYLHNGSLK